MSFPLQTRRDFVRLLGGAALAVSAPPLARAAANAPGDFVTVSIFHTTDLHGHILPTNDYHNHPDLGGLARCVTQNRKWREENPDSILIDIGDVYQGTQFALSDHGAGMIDLFNLLRYDAWLIGNHEFDWGITPFLDAVNRSNMPVLAANTLLDGKPAGAFPDAKHPFAKIQPLIVRQIGGIKIAIIGLTTPGMPFWFPSDFTKGIEFQNPVEPTRRAIARAQSLGADAVILAGHMGLKERTGGDDFANHCIALTGEFREAAAFIAGHTHQDIPSRLTNNIVLTQADHFGIHVGRLDLTFDRASKKLLQAEARTELMDHRIALDPVILSRTRSQLDRAAAVLAEPVGDLAENLHPKSPDASPSEVEMLIAAAVTESLAESGLTIDGVFHGVFDDKHVFKKGPKTIGDIWKILPYENYLVTGDLLPNEVKIVMEEVWQTREPRGLAGFRISSDGQGPVRRLTNLSLADGRPVDPAKRYRIAFNTFDASSGGHRFIALRDLLARPEARRQFHPIQTRDAVIDYFRKHKVVRRFASDLRAAA